MEYLIDKYIEFKDRLIQQLIFSIVFTPGSVLLIYILILAAKSNYIKGNISQLVAAILIIISAIIGEYIAIIAIIELWNRSVVVELYEDKIVGYPRLGKHKYEMKYIDIISIGPKKGGGWVIQLSDKDNNKLFISQHINSLSKCMSIIREKAINVKNIDLRKWENDKRFWGE